MPSPTPNTTLILISETTKLAPHYVNIMAHFLA